MPKVPLVCVLAFLLLPSPLLFSPLLSFPLSPIPRSHPPSSPAPFHPRPPSLTPRPQGPHPPNIPLPSGTPIHRPALRPPLPLRHHRERTTAGSQRSAGRADERDAQGEEEGYQGGEFPEVDALDGRGGRRGRKGRWGVGLHIQIPAAAIPSPSSHSHHPHDLHPDARSPPQLDLPCISIARLAWTSNTNYIYPTPPQPLISHHTSKLSTKDSLPGSDDRRAANPAPLNRTFPPSCSARCGMQIKHRRTLPDPNHGRGGHIDLWLTPHRGRRTRELEGGRDWA